MYDVIECDYENISTARFVWGQAKKHVRILISDRVTCVAMLVEADYADCDVSHFASVIVAVSK